MLVAIAGGVAILLCALWIAVDPGWPLPLRVFGTLSSVFFGGCLVLAVARLTRPATLIADEHGVHEAAWPRKKRTLRWAEIACFSTMDMAGGDPLLSSEASRVVSVNLTPAGMHHRNSLEALVLEGGDVGLFSSYTVPADQLASQLEQLRAHYGTRH